MMKGGVLVRGLIKSHVFCHMKSPVRRISPRADQPVKKYILTGSTLPQSMLKCMLANSSGMSSSCLFESACRELGFKPWAGSNSKRGPRAQPPDLADVLLHETGVSWLRRQEEQTRPTRLWEETPQQLAVRLQQGVSRIRKEFDVRGLCMELPGRLSLLVCDTCGDRLAK